MRPFKKHKVTSTELRYDNLHIYDNSELAQQGFRSTKSNRFQFQKQNKRGFQDNEDIETELEHCKVIYDFKNLCDALDLSMKEYKSTEEPKTKVLKKKKKIKVNLNYGEDYEEELIDLNSKVKSIDSKLKFQKISKKQEKDLVFTNFTKDKEILSLIKINIPIIPTNFITTFKSKDLKKLPLNKHTASTLLSSKFIKKGTKVEKNESNVKKNITIPIEVDPIIKKRLNL